MTRAGLLEALRDVVGLGLPPLLRALRVDRRWAWTVWALVALNELRGLWVVWEIVSSKQISLAFSAVLW